MPDPRRDERALLKFANLIRVRPRTLAELEAATGQSERTVYRWLGYLREEGLDVITRRHGRRIKVSVL